MPKQPAPLESIVTGSTVAASGLTSGSALDFSGPHLIETQSLNIHYTRVPKGWLTTSYVDLSSVSSTYTHSFTELAYFIEARYSRVKSYDSFNTSTLQLPQKFTIYPVSSDVNGVNYGSVDASTLGPQGTILTTQPYYLRRPWIDGQDTEVTRDANGCNFIFITSGCDTSGSFDQHLAIGDTKYFWLLPALRGTFLGDYEKYAEQLLSPQYFLNGSYSTDQENFNMITQFIDQVGSRIRNATQNLPQGDGYYSVPAVDFAPTNKFYRLEGFAEYDYNRHDFS